MYKCQQRKGLFKNENSKRTKGTNGRGSWFLICILNLAQNGWHLARGCFASQTNWAGVRGKAPQVTLAHSSLRLPQ